MNLDLQFNRNRNHTYQMNHSYEKENKMQNQRETNIDEETLEEIGSGLNQISLRGKCPSCERCRLY